MGRFEIFVLRLILTGILAVLISRIFFQQSSLIKTVGLGGLMLGLAYVLEYVRKRNQ
jgi:hypothetical protein